MSFKLLMDKDSKKKDDSAVSAQVSHLREQAHSMDEYLVKDAQKQLESLSKSADISSELIFEIHRIQESARRQILLIDEIQKIKLRDQFLDRELPQAEKDVALEKAIEEAIKNHERELELAKLKADYDLWKDDFAKDQKAHLEILDQLLGLNPPLTPEQEEEFRNKLHRTEDEQKQDVERHKAIYRMRDLANESIDYRTAEKEKLQIVLDNPEAPIDELAREGVIKAQAVHDKVIEQHVEVLKNTEPHIEGVSKELEKLQELVDHLGGGDLAKEVVRRHHKKNYDEYSKKNDPNLEKFEQLIKEVGLEKELLNKNSQSDKSKDSKGKVQTRFQKKLDEIKKLLTPIRKVFEGNRKMENKTSARKEPLNKSKGRER